MSHYSEQYNKDILEAEVRRINQVKSDYINGDLTEEQLLEGIDLSKVHADLITDPWQHLFMGEAVDEDFGDILDEIRNPKKPRASFKNGEWVLK